MGAARSIAMDTSFLMLEHWHAHDFVFQLFFQTKGNENKEQSCLGLYSYPVLMAADILLYK